MYLKSIELSGFKSFPDRTKIEFGGGITAIVGPNGSGKSNIADAVRWVLGEQSSKTLRGTKMEDVVFSGTEKRGPVGFAEVTLNIDNSRRILASDYDEVSVTRRFYRSGESEFYINRQSVRLSDIHRLFMDTGLGRDGYSVIGQGKIDEILSVKSEDRREIFEEAAGITKLRYRKDEAEHKLEGTETNLIRIRDILTELEAQVGPLKEQSEKAKKYLAIRDELRSHEIDLWTDELDRVRVNTIKAGADLSVMKDDLAARRTDVEGMYACNEELSMQMRECDTQSEQLHGLVSEEQERLAAAGSAFSVAHNTIENNKTNIERCKNELAASENRSESLSAQIEAHKNNIENMSRQSAAEAAELATLTSQAAELAKGAQDANVKAEALAAAEAGEKDAAARETAKLAAAEAEKAAYAGRLEVLEKSIAEQRVSLGVQKDEDASVKAELLENEEKLTSVLNVINGYTLRVKKRETKLDEIKDRSYRLLMECNNLKNRRQMLGEMAREYEGFSGSVKAVMRESARGGLKNIHGTIASIIRVPDEYTVAIEVALGGALQNIVTDTEEDAKAAINMLKNTGGGRATFLPVSSVRGSELNEKNIQNEKNVAGIASDLISCDPKYKNIITSLLGRTVVIADIDSAIETAKKYSYRFRLVTTDGQVVNPGGSMTGGSTAKSTGVLSRQNEIEKLGGQIAKLDEQTETAAKEEKEAAREYEAAVYELEVARGEQREAEDAVLRLRASDEKHAQLMNALEAEIEKSERETAEIQSGMAKAGEIIKAVAAQIETHAGKAAEYASQRSLLGAGKTDIDEKSGVLTGRINEIRERAAGIAAGIEAARNSLAEISSIYESVSGDKNSINEMIESYEKQNETLEREAAQKTEEAARLEGRIGELREKVRLIGEKRMELERVRGENERAARTGNDELLKLEQQCARLENTLTNAEEQEKTVVERLWENYEITATEAFGLRKPVESAAKLNRRVNELKNERRNLGEVNVGAIEEYRQVGERYEFLAAQCADLEKGKAEIERLISGIVKEMETIFAQKFDIINRYFGETFNEMFGGGRAELSLSDPEDILGCGIEIHAQPPGKTLKSLSLLSGGEKAFVAIALYFAILKVRPSPFCVLDEIEAALDDVNVTRFARYLRGLNKASQFIVITHRRGTMEESDILYGVTMQERGVSKILSMSFEQIEKNFVLS